MHTIALLAIGIASLQPIAASTVNSTSPRIYSVESGINQSTVAYTTNKVKDTLHLWITAYSSSPDETDDTPFITATGNRVRDGIVATNLLPFGTKVMIPEFFGEKVFTVDDRMHPRKKENIDVWMPTKEEAIHFGLAYSKIIVLE